MPNTIGFTQNLSKNKGFNFALIY